MQQWLHDNIWEVLLLQPSLPAAAAAATALDEDCLLHCVENLRFQAHLQVFKLYPPHEIHVFRI
jgi:hypothetical protein